MATVRIDQKSLDLLRRACARNSAVELRYERSDGTTSRGRTRLLHLREDSILADQPQYTNGTPRIPLNRSVSVFLMLNGQRYEFVSSIAQDGVPIRLNEHQRIRGTVLLMPDELRESQRRAQYRVSVLGKDPIRLVMASAHPRIRNACPADAVPITAKMVNLSAGGAAVLIPPRFRRGVAQDQLYYLAFTLPGLEQQFVMLAAIRHTQFIKASESLRAGLAFLPWDGIDFRSDLRQIVQFVASVERNSLRRRK